MGVSPSPIIEQKDRSFYESKHPSGTTSSHQSSCGCHDCFLSQFKALRQHNVKSISVLIENFVKYKVKNKYGLLEEDDDDCMCVDHLVKRRATGCLNISKFLDKLKPSDNKPQGTNP